jgi:tRNA-uridine 2-sulfurtransferase
MRGRVVVLLSGGLDSMLAVRLMQEQGLEVEALNFRTTFTCCQNTAARAAHELGIRLSVIAEEEDYLDLIRRPKYGYGRGANPCVDCRIYMFERARRYMQQREALCVVSGEVLGQRPMSQKRRDLMLIARQAGLEGRLLRPLSARLLPPTLPEASGAIDRRQLFDFAGRSRKPLIELARQLGLKSIPSPSTGCALTEPQFAAKVHDLVRIDLGNTSWDFDLLKTGRHVRLDRQTKVIVGRREAENRQLEAMFGASDSRAEALVWPENFRGPAALVCGPPTDAALEFAAGLVLRYGTSEVDAPRVHVRRRAGEHVLAAVESLPVREAVPL